MEQKVRIKMRGIDISQFQGNVNFSKVKKSGIEFVMIRAGFGRYENQRDPYFERNYKAAKVAGLHVGAYWYSYAQSAADAVKEAQTCMKIIKGKQFDFPIFFDLEERSQFAKGRDHCDGLVKAFCGKLEKNGWFAGLYISRSPLQTYISPAVAKRYALWVAEYGSRCNYGGSYGIWQYSSTGRVSGISGNVDLDVSTVDYPSVIRKGGFNGYAKGSDKKSVDTLAREVISGKWGNGAERKKRLTAAGYDYKAVQKRVNELLR